MTSTPFNLFGILDLEELDTNLFRGQNARLPMPRVFGGQVLGQALIAAMRTVEGKHPHSLHAYFLRGGSMQKPIIFHVENTRDGRSFSTRRVVAKQGGKAIFNMAASFQMPETGLEHQIKMPDVPGPDQVACDKKTRLARSDEFPMLKMMSEIPWPLETRSCEPLNEVNPQKLAPIQNTWIRITEDLPDDQDIHKAALAFTSDVGFMGTCIRPHGVSFFNGDIVGASLDHAMWFHRPFRVNEWLLYAQDSPSSAHATGFNRGNFFNEKGQLVASTTQEGLIRPAKHLKL